MTHYALADLDWTEPDEHGWSYATVTLARGDTASNPTSSKPERAINGPAVVNYERSRSRIVMYVEDPTEPDVADTASYIDGR